MIYITVLLMSFLLSLFLIPKVVLMSAKKKLLDIPNDRKIHKKNSSRLGGFTFFPSIFFTIYVIVGYYSRIDNNFSDDVMSTWWLFNVSACALMYFIGFADDISEIRYSTKFICQVFASLLIISSGTWINNLYGIFGVNELPAWIGIPLSILFMVFIMNAINLIDGIDGLASGLSIVALASYGILFFHKEVLAPVLICTATIGTLIAFFRYNVFGLPNKHVKIFMGDSGTLLLGSIIGMLALKLLSQDISAGNLMSQQDLIVIYSVLIIPCFDVIRVMLYRLRNKTPIFCPDKNHIHHKLLAIGLTERLTLITILITSVCLLGGNVLLSMLLSVEYILIIDIIVWIVINMLISKKIQYIAKKTLQQ